MVAKVVAKKVARAEDGAGMVQRVATAELGGDGSAAAKLATVVATVVAKKVARTGEGTRMVQRATVKLGGDGSVAKQARKCLKQRLSTAQRGSMPRGV